MSEKMNPVKAKLVSLAGINWRNIALAVVGLALIIAGTLLPPTTEQKTLFFLGCIFLFVSSTLEKHKFFAILQVIVLAGTLIAFAPVCLFVKAAVPIILSIIAIIYFAVTGVLKDYVYIIGCIGLVFLAAGYAVSNPLIYLFGGLFLTIYSYLSFRQGAPIALVFAILNAVFTVTASIGVYRMFF